ncbi:MAG: tetratricopeptide repeat protein, partial [Holophagales bacterium]|nr:tetratricopeptide repeat protein [Holophagales bacterium]
LFLAVVLGFGVVTESLRREAVAARSEEEKARAEAAGLSDRREAILDFMEEVFEEAGPAAGRGRARTVEDLLRKAEERVEKDLKDDPKAQVELLDRLGRIYRKMGDSESAQRLTQRAYDLAREVYGPEHPETLTEFSNLAVIEAFDVGNYPEAEKKFRDLLLRRARAEQTGERLFKTRNNLATSLMMQGKLEEAEPLYLQVLNDRLQVLNERKAILEPEDEQAEMRIRSSQRSLAAFYYCAGDWEKSIEHLAGTLEVGSGDEEEDGDTNELAYASALNLRGRVALASGSLDTAERSLREALRIRKDRYRPGHLSIARTRLSLASVYVGTNISEASRLWKRARPVIDALPEGHWLHAQLQVVEGRLAAERGELETAERLLAEAAATLGGIRGARSTPTVQAWGFLEEVRARRREGEDGGAGTVAPPAVSPDGS